MSCNKCNATGFISYLENQSPLGSGMTWNEEIIDFCSCLDNSICPSCGMFWHENNEEFNQYCEDDNEEFSCIYCLWKSTDPPTPEPNEDYMMLTPEELIKPYSQRENY